jgi:hypothetical protein
MNKIFKIKNNSKSLHKFVYRQIFNKKDEVEELGKAYL